MNMKEPFWRRNESDVLGVDKIPSLKEKSAAYEGHDGRCG